MILPKRNALILLISSLYLLFLLSACNKGGTDEEDEIKNTLSSITVKVEQRVPDKAIISWTASENSIYRPDDTVKYVVSFSGMIKDTGLVAIRDTLYSLSADSVYEGRVLAYNKRGDTTSAPFTFKKYEGFLYTGTFLGSFLGCFGAYPSSRGGYSFWETDIPGETADMPAISHDTLFIECRQTYDAPLYAYNAKTGAVIWKGLTNKYLLCPPSYYQGKLYLHTDTAVLAADAASGQLLWSSNNTPQHPGTNPVVANGRVFVGSQIGLGGIYALDANTGKTLWSYFQEGQMCIRPLVTDNLLVFGTYAGYIYALDQSTGQLAWRTYLGGDCHLTPPIMAGNNIIVYSDESGWYALRPSDAYRVWHSYMQTNIIGAPAYGDGRIYFSTLGVQTALDAATGQSVWTQNGQSTIYTMTFANHELYVQGPSSILMTDPATGIPQAPVLYRALNVYEFSMKVNDSVYYNSRNGNYK